MMPAVTAVSRGGLVDGTGRGFHLFFHHFLGVFLLSFIAKAAYFFAWPDSPFAVDRVAYGPAFLRYLVVLSVVLSLGFIGLFIAGFATVTRHGARLPELPWDARIARCVAVAGYVLVAVSVYLNREILADLFSGRFLSMFARVLNAELAESGDAALAVLFTNIVRFFAIVVLVDAYVRRRWLNAVVFSIFFILQILLSAGSRFNMLASLLVFPLSLLFARPGMLKRTQAIVVVYVATFLLPMVSGVLLMLRIGGELALRNLFSGALATFDSLDHFLYFLANREVEFPNWAYYEDLLQILPRAFFPDKPALYGMIKLQVSMYPDSIGGGVAGSISYGHFPLSIMTMSYAFYGLVGIVVMALLSGAFVALIDRCAEKVNPLLAGAFIFHIVYAVNFIRQGLVNFLLAQTQIVYVPAVLVLGVMAIGVLSGRRRALGATAPG